MNLFLSLDKRIFNPFFAFNIIGCRKGDYYRYLAEFKAGEEKKLAAEQSKKAYEVFLFLS